MSNNSLITAMFEEIKGRLSTIEKEMGNDNTNQKHPSDAPRQEDQQKLITARELMKYIQKTVETSSQKDSEKMIFQIQNTKNDLTNSISELRTSIEGLKCSSKNKEKNFATSELRIWKIGSIIGMVSLLFCIGVLMIQNARLTDNDLKYRYINSIQGIDSTGLRNLETVFHINRDKDLINTIRKVVEEYESSVKTGIASKKINSNSEPETSPKK